MFGQHDYEKLCLDSRQNPRLRQHLNIHADLADSCQRLLIGMQPNSYVRPHIHIAPPKSETFIVLRGQLGVVRFESSGSVLRYDQLGPNKPLQVCEIPAETWHTVVALVDDTVFMEVKAGPFTPIRAEDFATWAPAAFSLEATSYLQNLRDLFQ